MAAATPAQHAGAILAPAFAFGLNTSTPAGAVHHLDGQRLLWPAGRFFATLSAEDGKASFIAMAASARAVTVLQLSPSRRHLAAAEQAGEGEAASVSVYSVAAEKRERVLGLSEHTASLSVSALSFSGDGKLLLVASGEPDWLVMLWHWQQSKVVQVVSGHDDAPLCCACLRPWDEGVMAVAGPHVVRGYRLDLKAAAPTPPKHSNWLMLDSHGGSRITCMAHLVGGMLAVGTDAGQVLICGPRGLISSFDVAAQPRSASAACSGVQALVQRGRGFVAAGSRGEVLLFEPPGASSAGSRSGKEADVFSLSRRFVFAEASSGSCSSSATQGWQQPDTTSSSGSFDHLPPALRVIGLSVSATDDQLAVATAAGQLHLLNLTAAAEAEDEAVAAAALGSDMAAGEPAAAQGGIPNSPPAARSSEADVLQDEEQWPVQWASVCGGFARGRVVGLDAATHLPHLLVASEDGGVRVWDWMRRQRLAARQLEVEQPLCCALHPSGLLAAVGTAEVLRVFWVLMGELSPVAELPVARCSLARYSHGGGLLAAVGRNNAIVLYPSFFGDPPACSRAAGSKAASGSRRHGAVPHAGGVPSHLRSASALAPVAVLKGHVSSVTALAFTADDSRLISSGAGGALYTWDVATGSRLVELDHVDKKLVFCAAGFSDLHGAAAVRSMDGRLQLVRNGQLLHEASGLGTGCCPMALVTGGRVALAATASGSVISMDLPDAGEPDPAAEADEQLQQLLDSAGPVARPARGGSHAGLSVQVDCSPFAQLAAQLTNKAAAGVGQQQQQGAEAPSTPNSKGEAEAAGLVPGWREYRLHASRITAMKVLHSAGLLFTASADGVVLMSSLSLVLDGQLLEPAPLSLPPSATAHSSLGLTATAGAGSAGAGSAGPLTGPPGSIPGMAPAVVLVDEAKILSMQEQTRQLHRNLRAMQRESQWQVLRQTQALRESLARQQADANVQVAALTAQVASLQHARADVASGQDRVVAEVEALHLAAAEQLEGLYEARLALEAERMRQLAAAKDDVELSLKEELTRQAAAAERQLADVHSSYRQQLAAETARADAATVAASELDAVYQQVLMQTEQELDRRAETDGNRLTAAQRSAEEVQVKLRAEVHILQRASARLKADKVADAARVAALQQQVTGLQRQLADAAAAAAKLRTEIAERDGTISEGCSTAQGLRRRVQELETHKFVLTHQAEAVAAELQPKAEQVERLQSTIDYMDRELLAGRSSLLAVKRAVGDKAAAVAVAKTELFELRHRMAHQAALLDNVAHDIAHVLQQPADERLPGGKSAAQAALEQLAFKFCSKRGGGAQTSVQVEAELAAHISAAERKALLLQGQLRDAQASNNRSRRRLMADNSMLLTDLAELQRTNRELGAKLAAAQAAAAAALPAGNAAASAAAPATSTGTREPPECRARRSQGGCTGGELVPAHDGRLLAAALAEQHKQLAAMRSALDAATGVVALQAAQITHLQQRATEAEQQQPHSTRGTAATSAPRPSTASPPAAGRLSPSLQPVGGADRRKAAGQSWGASGNPGAGVGPRPRTAGVGGQGMVAELRAGLEAYRAK